MGARKLELNLDNVQGVISKSKIGIILLEDGGCLLCSSKDSQKILKEIQRANKKEVSCNIIRIRWSDLKSIYKVVKN